MNEKKICPKCGKRAMVKTIDPEGNIVLVCEICSTKRGSFRKDKKIDVV